MIPHNLHVALRFYLFSCFFHQKTHPYVHFHPGQPSITHLPFAVLAQVHNSRVETKPATMAPIVCMREGTEATPLATFGVRRSRLRGQQRKHSWPQWLGKHCQHGQAARHASQLYGLCETLKVPKSAKKSVGMPKASLRISLSISE